MNADFDRSGELSLSQTDEASQRRDVLSELEESPHEPLSQAGRNRSLEPFLCQFGDMRLVASYVTFLVVRHLSGRGNARRRQKAGARPSDKRVGYEVPAPLTPDQKAQLQAKPRHSRLEQVGAFYSETTPNSLR